MSGATRRVQRTQRWSRLRDRLSPGRPLVIANLDSRTNERLEELVLGAIERGDVALRPGELAHVVVEHDGWCPALKGGSCSCEPSILRSGGVA